MTSFCVDVGIAIDYELEDARGCMVTGVRTDFFDLRGKYTNAILLKNAKKKIIGLTEDFIQEHRGGITGKIKSIIVTPRLYEVTKIKEARTTSLAIKNGVIDPRPDLNRLKKNIKLKNVS